MHFGAHAPRSIKYAQPPATSPVDNLPTMSSTYAVLPPSLAETRPSDGSRESQNPLRHGNQHHAQPNHLSPYATSRARSAPASPVLNPDTHTPAESLSASSVHYQSSDYSEVCDDPFFGVDFGAAEGNSPSFLEGDLFAPSDQVEQFAREPTYPAPDQVSGKPRTDAYHPISPDKTPSLNTSSPQGERRRPPTSYFEQIPQSISPRELTKQFQTLEAPLGLDQSSYQLTPEASGSGRSSDDGVARAPAPPAPPTPLAMHCPSPRVTISTWESDNGLGDPAAAARNAAATSLAAQTSNFTINNHETPTGSTVRDDEGQWLPNAATGHQGIDPDNRPSTEVASSVNDLANQRKVAERNREVHDWLTDSSNSGTFDSARDSLPRTIHPSEQDDNIPQRDVPLGNETENKRIPGQTYFPEADAGELAPKDINIMRENRTWADGPVLHRIQGDGVKYQPESSQAAIEKFGAMCRDNDSVVSRAATWGTRRRSLPSVLDFEGVTSGSFLKKLSISRGDNRRPSILGGVRGLLKKPSTSFKRSRSPEDGSDESPTRESRDSLAPPTRTLSGGFGKKQSVPSINTALVSVTNSVAAVGATHVRGGSISASNITSPKSPSTLSLGVKAMIRRPRSGSELAGMWKKTGGPPVANLVKGAAAAPDQDDDDDDDDDVYDDSDMVGGADKTIDNIDPTFAGFREHVLKLNPELANMNNYLVDRIAHQQIQRYKGLLNTRVKHLRYVSSRNCPCGTMCIAQGGSAKGLDSKSDPRPADPSSARYDGSDENTTPRDGALSQEVFPQDIPMPPTSSLPAEFECQLCFQAKKFQKPSDWTKHVHEDVSPFTCTWDRCKDPKPFKRKADWVRHENEGHRHLEWWLCDVDDCRHICYRRDNFLQHLVREHKFAEPKVKTKAAIKRAGALDPTWQMVERCHQETRVRPQDEPCRFCGRTFLTWKKLTVHLAKHMEQVSLPVLRLVARKELDTDTIISPVQDPPPRSFPALPAEHEATVFNQTSTMGHTSILNRAPHSVPFTAPHPQAYIYNTAGPPSMSSVPPATSSLSGPQFNQPFYEQNLFNSLPQNIEPSAMGMQVGHGFSSTRTQGYSMPVTTDAYISPQNPYSSVSPVGEPFPALDMTSLGLHGLEDTAGRPGPYDNMIVPSSAGPEQYPHQGTASPFSHSPNQGQGQGGFYTNGQ